MTLSIAELRSISILGKINRPRNGNEWDIEIESGDGINTNFGYNHSQLVEIGLIKV
jgi:hypothetical protein